jgi:hypothetical protein
MKFLNRYSIACVLGLFLATVAFSSCEKDDNPNDLPDVSPADFTGKIDGYGSSDEIYPSNLKAYWNFDDNKNETKTSTAPTQTLNDTYIIGMKGKAVKLTGGYLYYAKQFDAFKTDALKNFTISVWVQLLNNGSKKTMLMQLARPGIFDGSLDFRLNTNSYAASVTDKLSVGPRFTTLGGGSQDNLNATLNPKIGADVWTHLVLTYDSNTGIFKEWANGVDIGSYNSRGTGNNVFKAYEPSEFIIGANYNLIPGKTINADANFALMTGSIDELRIYDTVIPDAHIKALYNLGLAGK